MNESDFKLVLNYKLTQSNNEAIVFITKVCKITMYIARLLLIHSTNNKDKGEAIYLALPLLSKQSVKEFTDYKLHVIISFQYGS